jgi:hypothetical protein
VGLPRRLAPMTRTILQRRLVDVSDRLKRLRSELTVTDEQVAFLDGEAEEFRLRALVSETPLADAEARDARQQADTMTRYRDGLVVQIGRLQRELDELLDRMAAELSAS